MAVSPVLAQRWAVRMTFDPALRARVYAGARVAGLTPELRALLVRPDPRAWATDPERRARALSGLCEELPVAAALAGLARADAFFGADAFHAAVMDRAPLAPAFGRWIEAWAGPEARIDTAVAEVRRAAPAPPGPRWVRAPRVRLLRLPERTLARWSAVRAALGPDPLPGLLRPLPADLPRRGRGSEHVLVDGTGAEVRVEPAPEGLAGLLTRAARPTDRPTLVAWARGLGADAEEAEAVVDGLAADGLLVPTR